ncbi:hypothetical protein AMTRI_Chr07g27360 [Amborella trichopoda]
MDTVLWSSMIAAYGFHGYGREAIYLFEKMVGEGIKPNEIYLSWFDHGLEPNLEHYTCMVGLLGRLGFLKEAESLIQSMPFKPDPVILKTSLSACKIHGDAEVSKRVAEDLILMEPNDSAPYVLISIIHAASKRWEDVTRVRKAMRDSKREIHRFSKKLIVEIKGHGYEPDTSSVLHDMGEEEEEDCLADHSEKIPVAFGLMNSPQGCVIRVMRNLRLCIDCHVAIKLISKITMREIVVRDESSCKLARLYNSSLVAIFHPQRDDRKGIETWAKEIWKVPELKYKQLSNGPFLFSFPSVEGVVLALRTTFNVRFRGVPVQLSRWTANLGTFHWQKVWLTASSIPLHAWCLDTFKAIGAYYQILLSWSSASPPAPSFVTLGINSSLSNTSANQKQWKLVARRRPGRAQGQQNNHHPHPPPPKGNPPMRHSASPPPPPPPPPPTVPSCIVLGELELTPRAREPMPLAPPTAINTAQVDTCHSLVFPGRARPATSFNTPTL